MAELIRGKEYNPRRARQAKDYSGLCYGRITPTDIDGIIEFSNRLFVFLEYKGSGSPLATGQRLCIQRMVDAIQSQTKTAVAILADHWEHIGDDIDCANAEVRSIYYLGVWHQMDEKQTVRFVVDQFYKKVFGQQSQSN
jgi:hypothetical protein